MKFNSNFKKGHFFAGEVNQFLAEMVGIMLGDGSLYKDKRNLIHVSIAFNRKEKDYLDYVRNLFQIYFSSYNFSVTKYSNEFLLRNVSVKVGGFLVTKGLKIGNKKINDVSIPSWIFENKEYLMRVLRGLFDTDGCVYRKYANYAQIQFKFAGTNLIKDTKKVLEMLGFTPTKIMKDFSHGKEARKIYLTRQAEIEKFMFMINPKNPKNWSRYHKIKNGDAGIRTQIYRSLP